MSHAVFFENIVCRKAFSHGTIIRFWHLQMNRKGHSGISGSGQLRWRYLIVYIYVELKINST